MQLGFRTYVDNAKVLLNLSKLHAERKMNPPTVTAINFLPEFKLTSAKESGKPIIVDNSTVEHLLTTLCIAWQRPATNRVDTVILQSLTLHILTLVGEHYLLQNINMRLWRLHKRRYISTKIVKHSCENLQVEFTVNITER